MSKWIRKGDQVVVIAGNDKGKIGSVIAKSEERVVVQGVNIRKKHMKRTQQTQGGRIVEMEMPVHISNVRLCTKDGKPFRLRTKVKKEGGRDLVYLEGQREIVYRSAKKPA